MGGIALALVTPMFAFGDLLPSPGGIWESALPQNQAAPRQPNGPAVNDAVSHVQTQLINGPMTKPEDAIAAMHTLNDLPPGQQAMAIQQMDSLSFHTLIEEVPPEKRVELENLVSNTHDPRRKLELWAECQKSTTNAEAKARDVELGKGDDDRKRAANDVNAASDNGREVDAETKLLLAKKDLTEKDVQALMDRKKAERDLEKKYDINLGYDAAETDPAKRRTWTQGDIARLEGKLAKLPPDQRAFEAEKFKRSAADADTSGGQVTVSDAELGSAAAPTRDVAVAHAQHELAAPDLNPDEAAKGLDAFKNLPPDQLKDAVKDLQKSGDLKRMLDSLPPERRADVAPLLAATDKSDVDLGLQLWQVSAKGQLGKLKDGHEQKLGTSADDNAYKASMERAAAADDGEIDEEIAHLRAQGPLTEQNVKDLMDRKEKEFRIEMDYGVNLTNDTDASIAGMPRASRPISSPG
jgi:hypothetical protein